jgi:hypothetical protein
MTPTNQPSSFIQHSDLAAIAATYSARLGELTYRHVREIMTRDDDINETIHKIMQGPPPPSLGAPSHRHHNTTTPHNNYHNPASTHLAVRRLANRTSPHHRNGDHPHISTSALSSSVTSQHLTPPVRSGNSHNGQDSVSDCGTTTSGSDRSASLSSTAPIVTATPSRSPSPVISLTEPPELVTESGPSDIAAHSNQPTTPVPPPPPPATLFASINQTYEKHKLIERQRYCQHIRYRYEAVERRSDTAFEDAEMKGLDGELKSQVSWAETKLEEILTNTR